nr:MAG TPA: hypothetical protein [Bacteriophage sp.]
MNREQRRAQIKQLSKKFNGIDVTKGTLDIPIGDGDKVTLDLMSFDTIYYLSEMVEKFTDLQSSYAEDFTAIDSIKDKSKKSFAIVRVYKKIIDDFVYYIDKVFGVGATKRIFGNEAPMPQGIGEFIEDLSPILQAVSTLLTNENNGISNVQSVLSSSNVTKYSGDRLGNV